MTIGQNVAEIWRFFVFFKMADVHHLGFVMRVFRPPTQSIVVQHLVGIGRIVLNVCKFQYYASLAWKCLFTPPFGSYEVKQGSMETFCSFIPLPIQLTWRLTCQESDSVKIGSTVLSVEVSKIWGHSERKKTNKSSAVAEMGDCLATIDMGQKVGAAELLCPFRWGELGLHLTQCRLGRGRSSVILIHPAVWPQ